MHLRFPQFKLQLPVLVFTGLALVIVATCSAAQRYYFIDLGVAGTSDAARALGVSGNQQVGWSIGGGATRAILWSGSATNATDLTPQGYASAVAAGVSDGRQVGTGFLPAPSFTAHALFWSGSAESAIDLTPPGYLSSNGLAIAGNQEVGEALDVKTDYAHAVLWTGTPASAVDLHPAGFDTSWAYGTDGVHQVGIAYHGRSGGTIDHAIFWSGSAASAVDLTPAGYSMAQAYGIGGNQQVGDGIRPTASPYPDALLWSGSAASPVDLNPALSSESMAYATTGRQQVGFFVYAGIPHAVIWNGSSSDYQDLQMFVPSGFDGSEALGIDPATGTVVGLAIELDGRTTHAAEWILPEPGGAVLTAISAGGLLVWRRRAR